MQSQTGKATHQTAKTFHSSFSPLSAPLPSLTQVTIPMFASNCVCLCVCMCACVRHLKSWCTSSSMLRRRFCCRLPSLTLPNHRLIQPRERTPSRLAPLPMSCLWAEQELWTLDLPGIVAGSLQFRETHISSCS